MVPESALNEFERMVQKTFPKPEIIRVDYEKEPTTGASLLKIKVKI